MANWCYNSCEVSGPEEIRKEFFKQLRELIENLGQGGRAIFTNESAHWTEAEKNFLEPWLKQNKLRIDGCLFELQENGDDCYFSCDTKWNVPEGAYLSMSAAFPELTFTVGYDEPGMDFGGRFEFSGGSITSDEHGSSESNGGVFSEYAHLVLAAATLPLEEVMNYLSIDWSEPFEIDERTTDVTGIGKVLLWVVENGGGLPLEKKGRTIPKLEKLFQVAGLVCAPSWTGSSDGFNSEEDVVNTWKGISKKALLKEQKTFKEFVEEYRGLQTEED